MNDFPRISAPLRWTGAMTMAVLAVGLTANGAAQTAIYTENFPNSSTTAGKNFGTVGWNAHVGPTATDATNTTAVGSTDSAVIWYTAGQGGGIGYGFTADAKGGSLFWTTEIGSIDQQSVDSISFWSNNSNTTSTFRIAIRLDNNTPGNFADDLWYTTATTFFRDVGTQSGSSGNWATNGELELFNFTAQASAWMDLSFTPGVSLSLGPSARTQDLPSGAINAVGLYTVGTQLRFDTLQVVPEPSTLVLSAGALVGLLGIRWRRR